jgi:hypothetical protein
MSLVRVIVQLLQPVPWDLLGFQILPAARLLVNPLYFFSLGLLLGRRGGFVIFLLTFSSLFLGQICLSFNLRIQKSVPYNIFFDLDNLIITGAHIPIVRNYNFG